MTSPEIPEPGTPEPLTQAEFFDKCRAEHAALMRSMYGDESSPIHHNASWLAGYAQAERDQSDGRIARMICAALSGAVVGAVLVWVVM